MPDSAGIFLNQYGNDAIAINYDGTDPSDIIYSSLREGHEVVYDSDAIGPESNFNIDVTEIRGPVYFINEGYSGVWSNAISLLSETGVGSYNTTGVEQEMAIMAGLGVQTIRVHGNPYGYFTNSGDYINNLTDLASLCTGYGIKMIYCLYVAGGIGGAQEKVGWYDLMGDDATNSWDPLSPTNDWMWNTDGTGSIQTYINESIQESATGTDITYVPNFPLMYWMSGPGADYVALYDHVSYPSDGTGIHTEFWSGLQGYTRTVCNLFSGELSGALHSIDLSDGAQASIYVQDIFSQLPAVWAEFSGNFAYPTFSFNASVQAYTRLAQWIAYWNDLIHTEYSYIPTTYGGVISAAAITTSFYTVTNHNSLVDYMTFNDTAPGMIHGGSVIAIRDFCKNNFNRDTCFITNGFEVETLWNLYNAYYYNVGLSHYGLFQPHAYSETVRVIKPVKNLGTDTYIVPPNECFTGWYPYEQPNYTLYPYNGYIVRYTTDAGEYRTVYRRYDLTGYAAAYYNGEILDEPPWWRVEGVYNIDDGETYTYKIVDQNGSLYSNPTGGHIHWRYSKQGQINDKHIADPNIGYSIYSQDQSIIFGENLGIGSNVTGHARMPSIGYCIDPSTSITGYNSPVINLSFSAREFKGHDVRLAAIMSHSGVFNVNDTSGMAWYYAFPTRIRVKKTFGVQWRQSWYTTDDENEWTGGPISEYQLYSDTFVDLGAMETALDSQPANTYYRKVFVETNSSSDLSGARVYIDSADDISQIAIALEKVSGDATSLYTSIPGGYSGGDFTSPTGFNSGLLVGDVSGGDWVGVWLQFTLTGASFIPEDDITRSFKLAVEGFMT